MGILGTITIITRPYGLERSKVQRHDRRKRLLRRLIKGHRAIRKKRSKRRSKLKDLITIRNAQTYKVGEGFNWVKDKKVTGLYRVATAFSPDYLMLTNADKTETIIIKNENT